MTNELQKKIEEIKNSQVSKSEKIRQLAKLENANLSEYRIAKILDIIPQFVNNVLKKEREKKTK